MSMKRPRVLKVKRTIELVPTAPFNFATLHKPDHFPAADTQVGARDALADHAMARPAAEFEI